MVKRILVVFLLALTIVTGLVAARRAVKGSNDFDTFYNAGKAVITGEGIYYSGEYYETKEGSPFLYPPFAACLFAPFALLPLPVAAFLWNALSVGLFLFCAAASARILYADWGRVLSGTGWFDRLLITALLMAVLLDNLTMAQINILVLALTLGALLLGSKRRDFGCGALLAVAVFTKLTPALFLFFFFFKRRWKVLAGFAAAAIFLTLIIPTLIFGLEQNRIYHRQWAGRTLKPQLINWISSLKNEAPHPDKKTASVLEKDRRSVLLLDKNQSLAAPVTRLFLKDRPRYGYEPEPIYAARRYEKMPVLIPVPEPVLIWIIQGVQATLLLTIVLATLRTQSGPAVFPLIFLGMTLLSPWARSHQYISWIFVYLAILSEGRTSRLIAAARAAAIFYFLQAIPYGKAFGMGTWANLLLFTSYAAYLFRRPNTHA